MTALKSLPFRGLAALAVVTVLALGTGAHAQGFSRCDPVGKGPNAPAKIALKAQPEALSAMGPARVELRAEAKDPDGDKLQYSYTATAGRISGGGADPNAVWNLAGTMPGSYTATVEAYDGRGCTSAASVMVSLQY